MNITNHVVMKNALTLSLFACLLALSATAQTPVRTDSVIKRPVTANSSNRMNLSTSTQPDLVLTVTAIDKNANFYRVRFTVRNQGGGTVDLSKVYMQGNVYSNKGDLVTTGCSNILATSGSLSTGQEIQGSIGCTVTTPLYDNETYTYRVITDFQNTVPEGNEKNNTADITFKGHTATSGLANAKTMLNPGGITRFAPDLAIEIVSISASPADPRSFTATYKIRNVGSGAIDLKKYTVQGSVREESVSQFTPCGGHSLMYEGVSLAAGKEFTGTRQISATLSANKGYQFKIALVYQGEPIANGSPETDIGNNEATKFFSTGN